MRARVREDLQETDPLNYRWVESAVDGAIQRIVAEYSLHSPIEQQTDITTVYGEAELDISALSGLLKIESIEFPMGQTPKYFQTFNYWAGHLSMTDEGDGTTARVKWLKKHTLAVGSTTIPTEHDEIIVLGATGYLAMSASANTVDRAFIAGHYGTTSYKAWGIERIKRYDEKLREIARSSKAVQRQLYTVDD
jgi:hypothetical protein